MTGDAAATTDRMKVFISYSRADVAFADQIVLALTERGFEPLFDRHDMDAAENWRDRLAGLLLSCDTVVFILTDSSASSQVCAWELERAAKLGKRMIPIVAHELNDVTAPPTELAGLNWVYFYSDPKVPGSGFYDGLNKLDRGLRVDLEWLRVQTRLSERAFEWSRQRNDDLLLRGLALNEAEVWLSRAPIGATAPPLVSEFLTASASTEARRNAEAKAQIFEREEAVKRAEIAVRDKEVAAARLQATLAEKMRVDRRMRALSYFSLLLGFVLALGAAGAAWYLSNQHVASAERTATLYAESASILSNEGREGAAMLMALSGDALAQNGRIEKTFRPQGYYAGRAALERGYVSNRLMRSIGDGKSSASSIVFSSDGALLLAGGSAGGAQLFRAATGELVAKFAAQEQEDYSRSGGMFAAQKDDRRSEVMFADKQRQVVVAAPTGRVTVWDIAGQSVVSTRDLFDERAREIALSPDGAYVAAAGADGSVAIWRIADGERVKFVPPGAGTPNAITFASDGKAIVVGYLDGLVNEIPLGAGDTVGHSAPGFDPQPIAALAMSPDGAYIAAATEGGRLLYFDRMTSPAEIVLDGGHTITDVVFSPDSHRILTVSADTGFAMLWSPNLAGPPIATFNSELRDTPVLAFSPDGAEIAIGNSIATASLWQTDIGEQLAVLAGHEGQINAVAFSPSGDLALTGSSDGTARLWDVATSKAAGPDLVGHTGPVNAVAFSPDGQTAITGSDDKTARLWDVTTGKRGNVLTGFGAPVLSVAFSRDGSRVAAGAKDGKVRIWNMNTGVPAEFSAHTAPVNSIAFSRDGSRLLTGSEDRTAKLWRVLDRVLLQTFTRESTVWSAAFSPDERRVLIGATGADATLWPIEGGLPVKTYTGHLNNVASVAFSPDGSLVLTGSMDGTARLWRTEQGRATETFTGHMDGVRSAAFSPDGKRVLTGSLDGTARIWDIDPFLFASPEEQQAMACSKLKQLGVTKFSQEDYQRFPILTIEPPRPCSQEWAVAAAPATPAAEQRAPPKRSISPELRPVSTAP